MVAVALSAERHLDAKVNVEVRKEFGDHVNRVVLLTSEFGAAQKEYPILIHKNSASGSLEAHAILGLEKDENLFINGTAWMSKYVPAVFARGPFSLGYTKNPDGEKSSDIRIMIDEDHPRIGKYGEAIFSELGGETLYLEQIQRVLQVVDMGLNFDPNFYKQIIDMDLLEQVKISIRLSAEVEYTFSDYYTINQQKFRELEPKALHDLHVTGSLGPIFYLMSSLDNFQKLIDLKNKCDGLT
jgi:hypothetical protein